MGGGSAITLRTEIPRSHRKCLHLRLSKVFAGIGPRVVRCKREFYTDKSYDIKT